MCTTVLYSTCTYTHSFLRKVTQPLEVEKKGEEEDEDEEEEEVVVARSTQAVL